MGTMTDCQWKSSVRFLLMALRSAQDEPDPQTMNSKLMEIIDNLQKTLED